MMAVFLHHRLRHPHLHVGGWRLQDAALEEIGAELLADDMDGDDVELQLLELVVLLEEIAAGVTLPRPVLFSLSWIMSLRSSNCSLIEAALLLRDIRNHVLDLGEGEHGLECVLASESARLGAAEGRARRETGCSN